MSDDKRIGELKIDEFIWVVFVILSVINIFGDECEKDYCKNHVYEQKIRSKRIFTFTIFASLLIYLYLEYQRFNHYSECKIKGQNTSIWELRCFGGALVIVATVLFLYCQIVETDPANPSIL